MVLQHHTSKTRSDSSSHRTLASTTASSGGEVQRAICSSDERRVERSSSQLSPLTEDVWNIEDCNSPGWEGLCSVVSPVAALCPCHSLWQSRVLVCYSVAAAPDCRALDSPSTAQHRKLPATLGVCRVSPHTGTCWALPGRLYQPGDQPAPQC